MDKLLEYFTINRLKYWLGMLCIVEMNGKYMVSGRDLFVRYGVSRNDYDTWCNPMYIVKYCLVDTLEEAERILAHRAKRVRPI